MGCGGSDETPAEAAPLTEAQLTSALLSPDDVPDGYAQSDAGDTEDSTVFDGTCLADVSQFDDQVGDQPDATSKTEFTLDEDAGQGAISASLSTYPDADKVTAAMGAFYDSVTGCTNLSFTDDQGLSYDIDVSIGDEVTIDGADQQLRIGLTGSIGTSGQSLPIDFAFLVVQEGSSISTVGTSEVGKDYGINDRVDDFAQTQADRLADLAG
ncbi:hypothetical protein BH11ACT8_BH11ACT8_16050 [soil metagenome]